MPKLEGVLAELLEGLTATNLNIDQVADTLSDHAIYIEELGEEERGLVDRFLQDAFALWTSRARGAQGVEPLLHPEEEEP